ncbi:MULTISPECIES: helix-turn-helix domain-containing protein [Lactobacillaceae]|uniref:helix-turn-helix domain-containing protein n=1 Tax=Lactobacillaceae TaxID=33958 RepID=UPI001456FF25|nr:helix-turn-helix domain-containing protein [Lactobacillus sp. HBUAS51381]NLR09895.1 helix-turn-helix transcriptional regulator [Lactobacillus sp. HBUAS51381]
MNYLDLPLDSTIKYDIVCLHKSDHQYSMPFHKHTGFELELYISGDINLITDKLTYHMEPGFLTLIPPGVWHRTMTVHDVIPYERIVLNLKPNVIDQLSTSETNLADCFYVNGKNDINILKLDAQQMSTYVSLCHQLIPIIDASDYGSDIKRKALIAQIMLIANTASPFNRPDKKNMIPSLIKQITEFVDLNLSGDLTLSAFSSHFFLTSAYINRYFKSYMGLPLHTYIIEKRLELAKELLANGQSVSDTCIQCGFGNYSHFIRTFKAHVGVSPGHYHL